MPTTHITSQDFQSHKLNLKYNSGIVLFYYNWCPYCISLMPTLKHYSDKGGNVFMIEGTDNPLLFTEYNISIVPDIRKIKSDKSLSNKYEGERELEDLIKFAPILKKKKRKKLNKTQKRKTQKRKIKKLNKTQKRKIK